MRVTTWIDVQQEISVDVSIAEVMSSIAGLAESDQLPMFIDCISSVWRVLKSVPDERIAAMGDKQREVFSAALHAQADRFAKAGL